MFWRTLTAAARQGRAPRAILIAILSVAALLARQAPTGAAAAAARVFNRTAATAAIYTKPILSAAGINTSGLNAASDAGAVAAASSTSADIYTAPLVQPDSLVWEGSFRVSDRRYGSEFASFAYGGTALAFNPANNSLFVAGHENGQLVTEMTIPAITKGAALTELAIAGILQPFTDPTGRLINSINPDSPNQKKIGGMFPFGNRLHITAFDYYDGGGSQVLSHFISDMEFGYQSGPQRVNYCTPGSDTDCLGAGYFDGYFGTVPPEWQQAFGATTGHPVILNGNCCLNVISRTSWGPAVFTIDPTQLGTTDPSTDMTDQLVKTTGKGRPTPKPARRRDAVPALPRRRRPPARRPTSGCGSSRRPARAVAASAWGWATTPTCRRATAGPSASSSGTSSTPGATSARSSCRSPA